MLSVHQDIFNHRKATFNSVKPSEQAQPPMIITSYIGNILTPRFLPYTTGAWHVGN